jgi:hypothetical protein
MKPIYLTRVLSRGFPVVVQHLVFHPNQKGPVSLFNRHITSFADDPPTERVLSELVEETHQWFVDAQESEMTA